MLNDHGIVAEPSKATTSLAVSTGIEYRIVKIWKQLEEKTEKILTKDKGVDDASASSSMTNVAKARIALQEISYTRPVVPSRSSSTSRNRELLEKKIKPAKGNSSKSLASTAIIYEWFFKTNHPEFGVLLEDGVVGQQGIQAGPLMPSLDKYHQGIKQVL